VVPLIDILLVLLVIFMAVRPEVVFGLPVDLPQKSETTVEAPPDTIVVQVLADGTLRNQPGSGAMARTPAPAQGNFQAAGKPNCLCSR
jgi:biopolymer transport protein ExbD